MTEEQKLPVDDISRNSRQQIFTRYLLAGLIDLVVINFLNEHWDHLFIETFTISFLMAVMLQFLLQVAIKVEQYTDSFFEGSSGKRAKILRIITILVVLFISKLAIMEAINLVFGDRVVFGGPLHGIIAFIVVVLVIIITEQVLLKVYRSIA